jgi:hypothetical protein
MTTAHPTPRSLVAKYLSTKAPVPSEVNAIDFDGFVSSLKRMVEEERKSRAEHRERTLEVSRALTEFGKSFKSLPREFGPVWRSLYNAGQNHAEDPRTTSLLIQVGEAQRQFDLARRKLYGH